MEQFPLLTAFAAERSLLYESGSPPPGISDFYVYSPDMQYRYAFARQWDVGKPLVLWVGVNPGKGDTEERHRPTLERCIRWSKEWGAGGLMYGNLFAARHNKPSGLREFEDRVGPHNDDALKVLSKAAWRTVAAWGGSGPLGDRPKEVARLLINPVCLGLTASGQPRHPLYVRGDTVAVPWFIESK